MCIYRHHPLLHGLLVELPDPGGPFPAGARSRWLDAVAAVLDLLYGDAELERPVVVEGPPAPIVPLPQLRDELDDAARRQVEADRLDAQRYDVAALEAEALRPGPRPWTGDERRRARDPQPHDPERRGPGAWQALPRRGVDDLPELERTLAAGGPWRASTGEWARPLFCTFVIEPDPDLPVAEAAHPCGRRCSGEHGMRGHLARGHGLRGAAPDVVERREALIAEAVEAAVAELAAGAAEVEPTDLEQVAERARALATAHEDQAEAERLSWAPPVAPSPLDRDALTDLLGPAGNGKSGSAAHADEPEPEPEPELDPARLECPFPDTVNAGEPCGRPCADVDELDRHLRHAHRLVHAGREAEDRADYVDEAVEARDDRIAALDAGEPATLDAPAATASGQEATP